MRRSRTAHAVVFLTFLVACGPNARQKALATSFAALNAAHEGFVTWDAQHQQDIVAHATSLADGQAVLAKYREDRDPITRGFFVAYAAFSVALAGDTDAHVAAALQAAAQLYLLVKQLAPGVIP